MALFFIRSTSSVIGGSMWIAHRYYQTECILDKCWLSFQAEDFYSLNEEVAAEGIAAVAAGAAASAAGAAAEAAGPADTFPYIIPRGGDEVKRQ